MNNYICTDCANEALKGNKPNGGVYTAHKGKCDKCGKTEYLGHVNDFGLDNDLIFRNLSPLD